MKPFLLQTRLSGPWFTIARYATLEEAERALRQYETSEGEEVRILDETQQMGLFNE